MRRRFIRQHKKLQTNEFNYSFGKRASGINFLLLLFAKIAQQVTSHVIIFLWQSSFFSFLSHSSSQKQPNLAATASCYTINACGLFRHLFLHKIKEITYGLFECLQA